MHHQLAHPSMEVSLIRNGKKLECLTLNIKTRQCTLVEVPIEQEKTVDQKIAELAKCAIVDLEEDVPSFEEPYRQFDWQNYKISLSQFKNDLIWQIFNQKDQTICRFSVKSGTYLDFSQCLGYTKKLYRKYIMDNKIHISNEERVNFLKKFKITQIERSKNTHTPWIVHVRPFSQPSRLDNRLHATQFCWLVTMTSEGENNSGNHAAIVMEGLDVENKYFMHKAEFDPPVRSKVIHPKDLDYDERTEIWSFSSKKVKKMLEAIDNQACRKNPHRPSFNKKGIYSLNAKGSHNCCTWALENLKTYLNIDLGKSPFRLAMTHTKHFTRKPSYYKNKPVIKLL